MTGEARIVERITVYFLIPPNVAGLNVIGNVTATLLAVPTTVAPATFTPHRLFDRITAEPGTTPVGETSAVARIVDEVDRIVPREVHSLTRRAPDDLVAEQQVHLG